MKYLYLCSAGASLPAIRRPHRAELVNTSKNLWLKTRQHPRHALYPFYRTIIFSKVCRAVISLPMDVFKISKNEGHPLTRCLQSLSDTRMGR